MVPVILQCGGGGGEKQYCEKCPHAGGKCWRSPSFSGRLPLSVWCNEEARKAIIAEKNANAKKEGVPCGRITAPPKSQIDKYLKDKKEKKAKREGGGGGAPAGLFLDGIVDIDDPSFGTDAMGCAMGEDDIGNETKFRLGLEAGFTVTWSRRDHIALPTPRPRVRPLRDGR